MYRMYHLYQSRLCSWWSCEDDEDHGHMMGSKGLRVTQSTRSSARTRWLCPWWSGGLRAWWTPSWSVVHSTIHDHVYRMYHMYWNRWLCPWWSCENDEDHEHMMGSRGLRLTQSTHTPRCYDWYPPPPPPSYSFLGASGNSLGLTGVKTWEFGMFSLLHCLILSFCALTGM